MNGMNRKVVEYSALINHPHTCNDSLLLASSVWSILHYQSFTCNEVLYSSNQWFSIPGCDQIGLDLKQWEIQVFEAITIIITIIIFCFYIVLYTNISKRFTDILLPRSLDSILARTHCVHNLHSLGSIPARRYLTLKNCLTNNDMEIYSAYLNRFEIQESVNLSETPNYTGVFHLWFLIFDLMFNHSIHINIFTITIL